MLVPPENYSMVEDGIHRCSKLDAINISFLKSLELKSIIWINEEKPPRVLQQFIEDHNIRLFHMMNSNVLPEEDEITNVKYQEWMVLKPSIISKSIETILDTSNQNCLLMDKSEVIVGVLRHIQRWNYSSISNEYRLYASRASYKVEIFLELINLELVPHHEDAEVVEEGNNSIDSIIVEEEEKKFGIPIVNDYSTNHTNSAVTNIGNHSLTKAISIKRNSMDGNIHDYNTPNRYNYGQIGTSPAMRRLSIEHGLPGETSPLSSSIGRLSVSTSPQIPKNLLKLVEMRKKKKKEMQEVKEQEERELSINGGGTSELLNVPQTARPTQSVSVSHVHVNAQTGAAHFLSQQNQEGSQGTQGALPQSPPGHSHTPSLASTAARLEDFSMSPVAAQSDSSAAPAGAAQWKLYRPREDSVLVSRPTHRGRTPRPLQTAITVRLPPESCLPLWFVELRALCEEY